MKTELMNLGLSETESEVYISLLHKQKQTASSIARDTNLNRSVTYSVLENLIKKGIVSSVLINGIKHFMANGSASLSDFLKVKEKALNDLIPQIKELKAEDNSEVTVEVFQGINGGLALMKDIIKEGKDYIAFGEDSSFQNIFGTLAEQYVRQLKEKKIKEKLLVPEGQKVLKSKYSEVRYLPKEVKIPTITAIYGDKIAIGMFQKPHHSILIRSEDLASSYRSLFELLWKIAKK